MAVAIAHRYYQGWEPEDVDAGCEAGPQYTLRRHGRNVFVCKDGVEESPNHTSSDAGHKADLYTAHVEFWLLLVEFRITG
jgi:hypothetical protein